ncbi:MAG: hypothetical protein ACI8V7_000087 [Candidatus Paceibacteria bacterium]|jgi:hypothetical protein
MLEFISLKKPYGAWYENIRDRTGQHAEGYLPRYLKFNKAPNCKPLALFFLFDILCKVFA